MTRVSEQLRFDLTGNRIDGARQHADNVQETAISGRKLRKISDNPASTVRVLRNRTKLENIQQFRKGLDFAGGFLARTEYSLQSLLQVLARGSELAVQMSNDTYSADDREAVAQEIRQLISQAVSLGNTTYADRYVFGGFQTHQPPIGDDGNYLGDDGQIFVQVDENSFRPVNISGREVFGIPNELEGKEQAIIPTLRGLYDSLMVNNKEGIHTAINNLEKCMPRVINNTATIGVRRKALEDVTERLDRNEEHLLKDNNELEGADPIKSTMDLKRAETALQFTLQSSAKVLSPTLLSFLNGS